MTTTTTKTSGMTERNLIRPYYDCHLSSYILCLHRIIQTSESAGIVDGGMESTPSPSYCYRHDTALQSVRRSRAPSHVRFIYSQQCTELSLARDLQWASPRALHVHERATRGPCFCHADLFSKQPVLRKFWHSFFAYFTSNTRLFDD